MKITSRDAHTALNQYWESSRALKIRPRACGLTTLSWAHCSNLTTPLFRVVRRAGAGTRSVMRAGRARDKVSLCELLNVHSMYVQVKVTTSKKIDATKLVVRRCGAVTLTEMPCSAKIYVSIFVRAVHWMAYFHRRKPKFSLKLLRAFES